MRPSSIVSYIRQPSHGLFFILYVVMFLIVFAQAWTGDKVIAPSRQDLFLDAHAQSPSHRTENYKFSDYPLTYVTEGKVFLEGARSGWITTWTPFNELGRPTGHMSDLSPAYLPNWFISKFTGDAFAYVTRIAVLAAFLAGVFAFLLARELNLSPTAALVASLSLGLSPCLIYWATFPMFAEAYGWTVAALYGLVGYVRRNDMLSWSVIAFSVYSLIMSAYPVMVLYYAYLATGFFVYMCLRFRCFPRDRRHLMQMMMGLASAALIGLMAALPALIDTWVTTLQSARMHPSVEFLRAAIPPMSSTWDWSRFLAFWTFPQVFGDPITPGFPSLFNGRSVAPYVVFLLCAAPWRRTWGWWLATAILVAADAIPSIFAFAVQHLGLGISRSVPSVHAIVPLGLIAAISMDALGRPAERMASHGKQGDGLANARRLLLATLLYALLLANAVTASIHTQGHFDGRATLLLAIYLPALWMSLQRRWIGLFIAIVIVHLFVFERHQLLVQSRSAIAQSSPATTELQALLADGSRYAVLKSAEDFVPANLNVQMSLRSIHSYDSLSPTRYQDLIRRLGGESANYGRTNRAIDAGSIGSTDFMLANLGALVTRQPLGSPMVALQGDFSGLLVYKVLDRWGPYVRVPMDHVVGDGMGLKLMEPPVVERSAAKVLSDRGDTIDLELTVGSANESLLVVSQAYNANWRANARVQGRWVTARPVVVNGAYEGIVLPPGTEAVRLAFHPWIRWAWLGHTIFAVIGMVLVVISSRRVWRRRVLDQGEAVR